MVLTGRHAALFDRVAAGWVLGGLYREVAAQLVDHIPLGGSVLDVGTGPGRLLVEIARRRPDVKLMGIDPSTDMVRRAQDRARRAGLADDRIEVRSAVAESLPFANAGVDVIVSTLSAHHWSNIRAAITEQARVLKPGGRLAVCDLRRSSTAVATALGAQFAGASIERLRLGRPAGVIVVAHGVTKS